jgi:hypothetical protein
MNENIIIDVRAYLELFWEGEKGFSQDGMRDLDWQGADVQGCVLRGLNLAGLQMDNANFAKADLRGAILSRSAMPQAIFSHGRLDGANFSWANLMNAQLIGASAPNASFEGAKLTGAVLAMAHLEQANLRGADLRDACCDYANLTAADLTETNLDNASLVGARLDGTDWGSTLWDWTAVPYIPSLDNQLQARLSPMSHQNDLNRLRAELTIEIAGSQGNELRQKLGLWTAASLIATCHGQFIAPYWNLTPAQIQADLAERSYEQTLDAQ